jgi:hypothetical protein
MYTSYSNSGSISSSYSSFKDSPNHAKPNIEAKKGKPSKFQRYLCLTTIITGMCLTGIHLVWGFLLPYFGSFLRLENPDLTLSQINWCYYMAFIGIVPSILSYQGTVKWMGYQNLFQFTLLNFALLYFLLALFTSIFAYLIIFFFIGFTFSLGCINCYFMIYTSFPESPGFSAFICILGPSFSPVLFGNLIPMIVNPLRDAPTIATIEGVQKIMWFNAEIAGKLPEVWLELGITMLIFGIICPSLLEDYHYERDWYNLF